MRPSALHLIRLERPLPRSSGSFDIAKFGNTCLGCPHSEKHRVGLGSGLGLGLKEHAVLTVGADPVDGRDGEGEAQHALGGALPHGVAVLLRLRLRREVQVPEVPPHLSERVFTEHLQGGNCAPRHFCINVPSQPKQIPDPGKSCAQDDHSMNMAMPPANIPIVSGRNWHAALLVTDTGGSGWEPHGQYRCLSALLSSEVRCAC